MKLALFDLDHTLLPLDSDYSWGQFTVDIGWRDAQTHTRANDAFYEQYKAGTLDIEEYIRFSVAPLAEHGVAKSDAAHRRFMDEVILPAFTCVVVPNAILYLKAKPVYIDVDPLTFNLDAGLL